MKLLYKTKETQFEYNPFAKKPSNYSANEDVRQYDEKVLKYANNISLHLGNLLQITSGRLKKEHNRNQLHLLW